MDSFILALRTTLDEQGILLRTLAVSFAITSLFQLWKTTVPNVLTLITSSLGAAFVLRGSFPAFFALNCLSYGVARALQSSQRRWRNTVVSLVVLSVLFLVARHGNWGTTGTVWRSAGVTWFYLDMWMVLRLFVLFWEIGAGKQQTPGLLSFLSWANSPLFLAGPLLRCSHWPPVLRPETRRLRDPRWWGKGIAGVAMLGAGLTALSLLRASDSGAMSRTFVEKALIVFLVGPWGFYLSIAGVFLVIEDLAQLNGIKVGPSFERPYLQPNIAEFWARWNMTATSVFREFFFYNRWGGQSFHPYLNTVVVFLAVGLWHGSNVYWVSFGLLHALYFSSYLWFRTHRRGQSVPGRQILGRVVTYVCVCLAWYIPSKIAGLIQRMGIG